MILYVMNVHHPEKTQEQGGGKQSPPGPSPGHALPQEGKDPSHCFGGMMITRVMFYFNPIV